MWLNKNYMTFEEHKRCLFEEEIEVYQENTTAMKAEKKDPKGRRYPVKLRLSPGEITELSKHNFIYFFKLILTNLPSHFVLVN